MKGNQFKTTKSQSFGYEPKEWSRHNRQKGTKKDKGEILLEIIKYDNEARFRQYRKFIIELFQNYIYGSNLWYSFEPFSKDLIMQKIFEYKAYKCFYFLQILRNNGSINFTQTVPQDFKEFYFVRYRIELRKTKIYNIKKKIKEKTEK